MPTSRSYQDLCGIARALDVVGERWALLIVRELLFGPQRFSELRRVLAGTSANVIADRLRELAANGIIRRRQLPAPAASWVYELTAWGRQLEPVLLALGGWGLRSPRPPEPAVIGPTAVLLYLRARARPDPADAPAAVRIELDGQSWTALIHDGRLDIQIGETAEPDGSLRTDPKTLRDLIGRPAQLGPAIRTGAAGIDGDQQVIRRLLAQVAPADQVSPVPAGLPARG